MGKALYRAYRSRSFDDVVGQEHITSTLKNAIKSGRISHAYLFTGPRGVGKTSVARILAHEVNGLTYKDDEIHLDIIEIDAASNRRIDEIRDLRDKVHIAPTSARYKVYIIDEVHMLTREAFNALLKTLEEPPAHCIFILATTESHKVPETIVSRTQRFSFKPINTDSATVRLKDIASKEKIKITEEALLLLAEYGEGSFRDSISMLDQLGSLAKEIDADSVRTVLGLPEGSSIDRLIKLVDTGQSQQILDELNALHQQAVNPVIIAKQLSHSIRLQIVENGVQPEQIDLLKALVEVADSSDPQASLELALLEASSQSTPVPDAETIYRNSADESKTVEVKKAVEVSVSTKEDEPSSEVMNVKPDTSVGEFSLEKWPAIIERVKLEAASLYTALRLAEPKLEGSNLILSFQFPLHQKKVNNLQAKDLIGRIIQELTGSKVSIDCVIEKRSPTAVHETTGFSEMRDDSPVQSISNIFGGGEVLESEALS